ncbi:Ectonucleoside triphosphate diphosphohydrolase 5, partial [Stylophora pistillata]
GSQSIEGLLQKSEDVIPENRRKHTPVALKATAGLRLLPSNSSNQLLEEVRRLFQESPYHFSQESNVDIMDGTDEGLFAWITVNFLLGGLKRDSSKLFGTLDLGGGSTQITLWPVDQSFSLLHELVGANVRLSPCIHYNYRGSWKFGIHQSINFSGDNRYGYFGCLEDVKKAVAKFKVHKPVGIDPVPMYAFSYYYERAVDLGLIHSEKGGIITVGQFQEGAKQGTSF